MCWADLNNACKIKFEHKNLAKNLIFKTEDSVSVGKLKEKNMKTIKFLEP